MHVHRKVPAGTVLADTFPCSRAVRIGDIVEVARAHKEYFADIEPATTMIEVSALIEPEMLVEIEATAVLTLP